MELGCALMEKLFISLMMKLFHVSNRNLQDLLIFHAMTRLKSLFSRKIVESPSEKLTRNSRETRRETRRKKRGEVVCNSCTMGIGCESQDGNCLKKPAHAPLIYSLSNLLFVYY